VRRNPDTPALAPTEDGPIFRLGSSNETAVLIARVTLLRRRQGLMDEWPGGERSGSSPAWPLSPWRIQDV